MYIPRINLEQDKTEIVAFMQRFSFATLITSRDHIPLATHLPLLVSMRGNDVVLSGHFAKANAQWENIEQNKVLAIFSEPHAYISPKNYEKEQNVPTWNYISVHVYGKAKLIIDTDEVFEVLEATINNYEASYKAQWDVLSESYKLKMIKGIVAFEMIVDDIQANFKLSQNKTIAEKQITLPLPMRLWYLHWYLKAEYYRRVLWVIKLALNRLSTNYLKLQQRLNLHLNHQHNHSRFL